jgi:very-short-patch-repair endonuclease
MRALLLPVPPLFPSGSPAEEALERLWAYLGTEAVIDARFERDAWIAAWRADLLCRRARLVVDVVAADRPAPPARRDWLLAERGVSVLRLTAREVDADLPAALETIAQAVALGR